MRFFQPTTSVAALLVLVGCSVGLFGCGDKKESDKSTELVLATVNKEAITRADVDFTIERSFDRAYITRVDADLQQKILDSLIASRAMKQLVTQELSADEIDKIKRSSQAYEEELYVKAYLQRHTSAEPVTAEMVQEYYTQHPEEFGAESIRNFELLKAPNNLAEKQRDLLLGKVGVIRSTPDWTKAAASWQQELGLQYQQGRSKTGLLDKQLEQQIDNLKEGETSAVFYVDGAPYLVRVNKVVQSVPKSLGEVSGDIRKRLAPLMLRNAVKKSSDEARAKTQVVLMAPAKS